MINKDTSKVWRVRSVPRATQRSLTRYAKQRGMSNAEFLIMVDKFIKEGGLIL